MTKHFMVEEYRSVEKFLSGTSQLFREHLSRICYLAVE